MGSLGFQELLLLAVVVLGMLVPYIFFLITLQNALKTISPEYRQISPGTVWTMLIPVIGVVMLFIIANNIGSGFKKEFDRYAVFKQGKPTYALGLVFAILQSCYFVSSFMGTYLVSGLLSLGILVIWIVYWVQVNSVKNELLRLKTTFNLEGGEQSIFV